METAWSTPSAMALPKEGYFERVQGRYGPVYPKTPACHGVTIIAKIKPGQEDTVRDYGKAIEAAMAKDSSVLAALQLHYLRWATMSLEGAPYFLFQGIFDSDVDRYIEDGVALFTRGGLTTAFVNLEGFPDDWRTNVEGCIRFVREHHFPSFLEYGEYPYATSAEIRTALEVKGTLSHLLDLMQ